MNFGLTCRDADGRINVSTEGAYVAAWGTYLQMTLNSWTETLAMNQTSDFDWRTWGDEKHTFVWPIYNNTFDYFSGMIWHNVGATANTSNVCYFENQIYRRVIKLWFEVEQVTDERQDQYRDYMVIAI